MPATPVRRGRSVELRIRAAALEQLRAVGYRALTMEGVAAAAGVAKTSVYRRWSSRAGLVGDVLAELVTDSGSEPAPGSGRSADDLLELGRRIAAALGDPAVAGAVLGVLLEAGDDEVAAVRSTLVRRPAPGCHRAGPTAAESTDHSADAVAGAVLLRTLVLRLPVDEEYLRTLVERVTGPPAGEENP